MSGLRASANFRYWRDVGISEVAIQVIGF